MIRKFIPRITVIMLGALIMLGAVNAIAASNTVSGSRLDELTSAITINNKKPPAMHHEPDQDCMFAQAVIVMEPIKAN